MTDENGSLGGVSTSGQTGQTSSGQPWYSGRVDDATVGYLQTKGWDRDATHAALSAIAAHREAEKFIGAPASELLRVPKPDDAEGWKKVYQRLGAPADPKEYDFSSVMRADGSKIDETLESFVRTTAAELNLTKEAAAKLASKLVADRDRESSATLADTTAKLEDAKTALAKNWGENFDANLFIARQGAKALGVDPDTVAVLEKQVGYDKVMEMFRKVGVLGKEDRFISSQGGNSSGVMTREQAVSEKQMLMQDREWVKSYLAGDVQKQRQMTALNTLITAGQRHYQ